MKIEYRRQSYWGSLAAIFFWKTPSLDFYLQPFKHSNFKSLHFVGDFFPQIPIFFLIFHFLTHVFLLRNFFVLYCVGRYCHLDPNPKLNKQFWGSGFKRLKVVNSAYHYHEYCLKPLNKKWRVELSKKYQFKRLIDCYNVVF